MEVQAVTVTASPNPNPKPSTFGKRGRKGKRPRCTEGDGAIEDGGRHRKKSKTFDTSGSKLVTRSTEVPSTSGASSSSMSTSGGSGVTETQKRRIKPEALGPNNVGSMAKMLKIEPQTKTDANGTERAMPEEQTETAERKKANPAVTIEDIGNEEVEFAQKYRDPLDGESDISENENGSCVDDEEDSNSEGNWKNEYPDDASDFEHDYDRECSSSTDDSGSSESGGDGEGDFDDEGGDSQRFRSFNRKVTDQDIAACSSKLGQMLKNFHKDNGPVQVSPDTSRHASYSPYDSSDDDEDYFGNSRGHSKSRFLDDGLAEEVVSSASEAD